MADKSFNTRRAPGLLEDIKNEKHEIRAMTMSPLLRTMINRHTPCILAYSCSHAQSSKSNIDSETGQLAPMTRASPEPGKRSEALPGRSACYTTPTTHLSRHSLKFWASTSTCRRQQYTWPPHNYIYNLPLTSCAGRLSVGEFGHKPSR